MKEIRKQLLAVLLQIREHGPEDEFAGICGNVEEAFDKLGGYPGVPVDDMLSKLFSSWPNKASCRVYPVGNWSTTTNKIFWFHFDNKISMWDKATRYGAARCDLLDHCIAELEKEFN